MKNLSSEVFDSIVRNIFRIDMNSSKEKHIIKCSWDAFINFWNKYNKNILKLIDKYKKIRYFYVFTSLIIILIKY